MHSLKYVSGSTGEEFALHGESLNAGTCAELRAREWSYALDGGALRDVSRETRECALTITSPHRAAIDAIETAFDADMAAAKPGKLVIDNEIVARVYAPKSEPKTISPWLVSVAVTVVLLDGVWVKEHKRQYPKGIKHDYARLDLPTDMPFDLKPPTASSTLDCPTLSPAPFKLTIYGPATSPYIIIGDNRYEVDVIVESGGILVINAADKPKTITLYDALGNEINAFAKGKRGAGSYIFQPVPAGKSYVSWDGSFGFDLTLYEERSEPRWA